MEHNAALTVRRDEALEQAKDLRTALETAQADGSRAKALNDTMGR